MNTTNNIFKLTGKVQHYAWGGFEFIPNLLHLSNAEHTPFAEYWMGAHTSASSNILVGEEMVALNKLINQNPPTVLGNKVYEDFGELPYLFKVLDVHDMLSIQVHPSKDEAIKGFEAEEAAGIPINAATRNYKDKNHKPEVMVALSDFWLLHGFKNEDAIEQTLEEVPELTRFLLLFRKEGYKALYQLLMELEPTEVDSLLKPLVERELRRKKAGELTQNHAGWWVAKLYEQEQALKNIDKGVFSIYLFNIVNLRIGEAIFQAAGIPHAYLQGQNVELMANSDNVLRGGLTPKHVDVPELLKHTLFEGITPQIIKPNTAKKEVVYPCPVADFGISRIQLQEGEVFTALTTSLEILLVTDGACIAGDEKNLLLKRGEAIAIFADSEYKLTAVGNTVLYRAFVPV
jgi:mannose-6-phosphate isomerase